MKHSSTNTIEESFFALLIILSKYFFDKSFPVGLFGLQIKTQPFFGICEINESIFSDKFSVLKYDNLALFNFAAVSYSAFACEGLVLLRSSHAVLPGLWLDR